jgi:hypothetical protein
VGAQYRLGMQFLQHFIDYAGSRTNVWGGAFVKRYDKLSSVDVYLMGVKKYEKI